AADAVGSTGRAGRGNSPRDSPGRGPTTMRTRGAACIRPTRALFASSRWSATLAWLHATAMALPSVLLVLVACSPASPFHASIALKPVPPPPSVTKIPVTVGIYYAPAFRTYEHTWRQDGTTFHLNVGNASMRLLTACVAALAERTLVVARRPPLRAVPPVAAVIEAAI